MWGDFVIEPSVMLIIMIIIHCIKSCETVPDTKNLFLNGATSGWVVLGVSYWESVNWGI